MYLYLYHDENQLNKPKEAFNQKQRSDFRELLVRKALKDYAERQQLKMKESELEQIMIRKEEKGKPYFALLSKDCTETKLTTHYSVSHSGSWWGCLMAEEPVGFDLEVHREHVSYEKIAQRYFTEGEHEIICAEGLETFFEIWVRKEAIVKYLGSGLAEGLDSFSVIKEGCFLKEINLNEKSDREPLSCIINTCEIQNGVKSAYCSESGTLIRNIITLE